MFIGGMYDFAPAYRRLALVCSYRRGDRQIDQVVILVRPHVQDGFQFHLLRLGVIGQHLVSYMQRANRLFTLLGPHARIWGEATGGAWSTYRHWGDKASPTTACLCLRQAAMWLNTDDGTT